MSFLSWETESEEEYFGVLLLCQLIIVPDKVVFIRTQGQFFGSVFFWRLNLQNVDYTETLGG